MKAKDKARELVETMSLATDEFGYINTNVHRHKQCALIAVDEIIKELIVMDFANKFNYWNEVKYEISQL